MSNPQCTNDQLTATAVFLCTSKTRSFISNILPRDATYAGATEKNVEKKTLKR